MKVQILGRKGPKVVNINRRRAIRERCMICSNWSPKEVFECGHVDCPLYPYRTGQGRQDAVERGRAIRAYCLWCMCDQSHEVRLCPSKDCPLFPYRQSAVDRTVEIDR